MTTGQPAAGGAEPAGRQLRPIPALDGIRAFAVLGTAAVHLMPFAVPGGFVGVDVFFVLSGFLISSLLIGEFEYRQSIDLRRFYARRLRRLYPALLALLALYVVWIAIRHATHPVRIDVITIAVSALYVQNLVGVIGHHVPWQVDHLWSLSVEEQFYLAIPLLLVLLLRRRVRGGRLVGLFLALAALSALAQAVSWILWHKLNVAYLFTPLHACGLLLGCALGAAYVHRTWDPLLSRLGRMTWVPLLCVAGLVVLAVTLSVVGASTYLFGITTASVLSWVLVASCVLAPRRSRMTVPGLLQHPVPAAVGRRTYSLYLWQNPVMWALTGPLRHAPFPALVLGNVAVTAACAELSFRYVERPFLSRRRMAVSTAAASVGPASAEAGIPSPRDHSPIADGRGAGQGAQGVLPVLPGTASVASDGALQGTDGVARDVAGDDGHRRQHGPVLDHITRHRRAAQPHHLQRWSSGGAAVAADRDVGA